MAPFTPTASLAAAPRALTGPDPPVTAAGGFSSGQIAAARSAAASYMGVVLLYLNGAGLNGFPAASLPLVHLIVGTWFQPDRAIVSRTKPTAD
jgi:hypothetical protein